MVIITNACYPETYVRGSESYVSALFLTGKETPNTDIVNVFSSAEYTIPDFIWKRKTGIVLTTTVLDSTNMTVNPCPLTNHGRL